MLGIMESTMQDGNGELKFIKNDSCPDCSERLKWETGDFVYCENCGAEYEVDWSRLLEEIPEEK